MLLRIIQKKQIFKYAYNYQCNILLSMFLFMKLRILKCFYKVYRLKLRALLMSGIGKVFQSVAKNVDASDISKLAKSQTVKKAVNEGASEIGEALAQGLSKNSTDVSSTIIQETSEAVSTQSTKKGFLGWIKNLFKGKNANVNVSTKTATNGAVDQTADDLQNQILELQKQNKKLQKANNKMQKANNKAQKKIKTLNENIKICENNMSAQELKQAKVDKMNWFQKLFSSECKFNWDNFKWEAC